MKVLGVIAAFVLGSAGLAAATTQSGVKINVDPPQISRRTFDPNNQPGEMPKLIPPEVGTCVYSFGCSTEVVMSGVRGRTARVTGIQVTTRLSVTVWTPQQGPPKILVHEEGHRALAEMYYQLAEPVARRLAERELGKPIPVQVRDQRAAEAELKKIQDALIAEYLRETATRCDFAQARYDVITEHSMNPRPESEAIARAVAEEEAEYARLRSLMRRPPTRPAH